MKKTKAPPPVTQENNSLRECEKLSITYIAVLIECTQYTNIRSEVHKAVLSLPYYTNITLPGITQGSDTRAVKQLVDVRTHSLLKNSQFQQKL